MKVLSFEFLKFKIFFNFQSITKAIREGSGDLVHNENHCKVQK